MSKKIIISFIITLFITFLATYSFATMNMVNDVTNGVKNGVSSAENIAENVAGSAAGAIKEGTNKIQDSGKSMTENIKDSMTDDNNNNNDYTASDSYTASRTSTGMFGISNNVWTWLILAAIAAVIIGLIMFYVLQRNNSYED